MRLATVDVGTNTILLLIADVASDGSLHPVHEEERFVRLGEGVDASGMLAPAAMERVLDALRAYAERAAELGAPIVSVGATSASRDSANSEAFAARVRAETGLEYEVLSGEEEATYSFRAAISSLPRVDRACVLDVGGGSTELVAGPSSGDGLDRRSLDVGSVRLTERFFGALPPYAEAVRAAEEFINGELATVGFGRGLPLVGVAGTVTSLARLAERAGMTATLTIEEVEDWSGRLLRLPVDQIRALNPEVLAARADVFSAGVLIVAAVMRHLQAEELVVSFRGLRHGLMLRWLERNGPSR